MYLHGRGQVLLASAGRACIIHDVDLTELFLDDRTCPEGDKSSELLPGFSKPATFWSMVFGGL